MIFFITLLFAIVSAVIYLFEGVMLGVMVCGLLLTAALVAAVFTPKK